MDKFSTSDIVLASCLKLAGYELDHIDRDGNKGVFVFNAVDQQFIDDVDLGKHKVEPVQFNNTIRHLTTSVRRMLNS
jgi:hypothetical protein